MLGDLLGEWMRLTGEGSISQYRQKAIWLAGTANLRLDKGEPGRWLRDLSDRGYVELDWRQGKWSSCLPAITRLPNSDGLAVLAGFVSPKCFEALADINVDIHYVECPAAEGGLDGPRVRIIQYSSIDDLKDAAKSMNAQYVPCAALQLAAALEPVAVGRESAPPNRQNETIAYFDPAQFRWLGGLTDLTRSGLYRYEGNGRRNFLWHEHGTWWHCDMSDGVWMALSRSTVSAIRWRPYPGQDPETGQGTLFVDLGAPLPPLHRRSLVLCSGMSPRVNLSARNLRYDNVPRAIADTVCITLGQPTQVLPTDQPNSLSS